MEDPTGATIAVPIQKFERTTDCRRKETLRKYEKTQRPWTVMTVEDILAKRAGYLPARIDHQLQFKSSESFQMTSRDGDPSPLAE